MAKEYVEKLTALLDTAKPKLPRGHSLGKEPIEVKHFFGGAAGYVDGHIFMSLTKAGLAIKLPEDAREQLFRSKQAKKLRHFPKAPIKKQYALFPRKFLDDDASVKRWIERSVTFVLSDDD